MDERAFMGVVQAIAGEVEYEQRLERGAALGATYLHCRRLLRTFDPAKCPLKRPDPTGQREFARYAFDSVKMSLTRDITRERRAARGLKHDGVERKPRTPAPDFVEAALPDEMPPWWPMLSAKQKSIVLLLAEKVRVNKIAFYLAMEPEAVEAELAAVRHTLSNNRVPLCDVPRSLDDPDAAHLECDDDDELDH